MAEPVRQSGAATPLTHAHDTAPAQLMNQRSDKQGQPKHRTSRSRKRSGRESSGSRSDPGAGGSSGRRVLIADDNIDSAESIAMVFRIFGHEVNVVYDGESAVAEFRAFAPHFVLLDIGMPKLNGYEVARQIRAAAGARDVKLVALTGWGQKSDKERAFEAGFDHHFTKPVDPEMLSELIY